MTDRLPIHIDVKASTVNRNMEAPDATDVFVSGNGYQWSGFTVKYLRDLRALRDAISTRLEELGD